MEKDQLKKELAKVHNKLNNLDSISEDEKSSLKKLMSDIQNLLERSGDKTKEESENIIDELKETTSEFDAKYPELSESIKIIIHTLSNMGI